mgnify:CR=1 FL=1
MNATGGLLRAEIMWRPYVEVTAGQTGLEAIPAACAGDVLVLFEMVLVHRLERFRRMAVIGAGTLLLCAGAAISAGEEPTRLKTSSGVRAEERREAGNGRPLLRLREPEREVALARGREARRDEPRVGDSAGSCAG